MTLRPSVPAAQAFSAIGCLELTKEAIEKKVTEQLLTLTVNQIAEALKEARKRTVDYSPHAAWGTDAAIVLVAYALNRQYPAEFRKLSMSAFAAQCGMVNWPYGFDD
jgi:hypothetical protein